MDLERVERELTKRTSIPYKWGRKQTNIWDKKTNFIYKTYSVKRLMEIMDTLNSQEKNYALNRWFNFWSAMAVEHIFCSHQIVKPNTNSYDRLIDFSINAIPFDHKTSIFPKGFGKSYTYAKNNKKELIEWLYENQSQENRKHLKNRLYIVLFDAKNYKHWELKAKISLLKIQIDNYIMNFNSKNLIHLTFNNETVVSDIIWIENA